MNNSRFLIYYVSRGWYRI